MIKELESMITARDKKLMAIYKARSAVSDRMQKRIG